MHVLVAIGDKHAAYRETIAAALRCLRPELEVSSARTPEVHGGAVREGPDVVICDRTVPEIPGAWLSWVHLSIEPGEPSTVSVRGVRSETVNPGLDGLLSAIDRTQKALSEYPKERGTGR